MDSEASRWDCRVNEARPVGMIGIKESFRLFNGMVKAGWVSPVVSRFKRGLVDETAGPRFIRRQLVDTSHQLPDATHRIFKIKSW